MLIEAFKATLEEVRTAEMLLHVVDASSPLQAERMEIVERVLEEIGAGATPRIVVMNKSDLLDRSHAAHAGSGLDVVRVSALKQQGLQALLDSLARFFASRREEVSVSLPATRGDLVAMARRDGLVLSEEYFDGRVSMRAVVSPPVAGRLRRASHAAS
jgi:GTP-binding protein HflX